MKKIVFFIALALALCLPADYAKAVDGSVFAKNTTISQSYLTLTADATRAQTFTATVDNFTGFYAYLMDRVNGSAIAAYLINESSKEVVEISSQRMGDGSGWEEFNFNSPLSKESVYRVKILVPTASGVKWVYSGNTYDGGMRYYGENTYDEATDMSFQAWGYDNPVATTPTPTPATTTTVAADATVSSATSDGTNVTASSETPTTNSSSSIVKPSELKAEYSDGVAKLSWRPSSSTDITGYKVFRSQTKGKDYQKIGQTEKSVTSYTDISVTAGNTYYYIVRAYNGSDQSASSNEASVTVSDNGDGSVVTSSDESILNGEYTAPTNSYLSWVLGIAALVLTLILLILIKRRQDKAKKGKVAN